MRGKDGPCMHRRHGAWLACVACLSAGRCPPHTATPPPPPSVLLPSRAAGLAFAPPAPGGAGAGAVRLTSRLAAWDECPHQRANSRGRAHKNVPAMLNNAWLLRTWPGPRKCLSLSIDSVRILPNLGCDQALFVSISFF